MKLWNRFEKNKHFQTRAICVFIYFQVCVCAWSLKWFVFNFQGYVPPFELRANDFWIKNTTTHKCLTNRLKVVVFKGFKGSWNEILLLRYFLNFGQVLERLALYSEDRLNEDEKKTIMEKAKDIKNTIKASPLVQIILYIDGISTNI